MHPKHTIPGDDKLRSGPSQYSELVGYQSDSIVSRTIIDNRAGSVTVFAFDKGQKLSEHTAPFDALVHVIEGTAKITIEGVDYSVSDGQQIIMPAGIPHAVKADERFKMVLVMIRNQ